MSKIPCEIVRDLLPSYVDQLTNETTNQYMEEHLAECSPCRELYETMKAPETLQPSAEDGSRTGEGENCDTGAKKEIDFLKKNRRRNKGILWGCIAALVVILGVLFVTRYMLGRDMNDPNGDYFMWDLQVNEDQLSLEGRVVNDIFKITGWDAGDEDGIVKINAKIVSSGFVASMIYGKEFHYNYTASEPIRQVIVNDRILYSDGEAVSMMASSTYQTRHLYIGNMSQNNLTANRLNISNYLGSYLNELQTSVEPFGWTLHLQEDIPVDRQAIREQDMESFAYVLLAMIDNLGEVSYDYTVDGKFFTKTVTTQDATTFFGQEIKNCYDNVNLLEELLRKTGLDHYAFGGVYAQGMYDAAVETAFPEDTTTTAEDGPRTSPIVVNIVNNTDETIKGIMASFYIDDELVESQGAEHADGTAIERGQLMGFSIEAEYLDGKLTDNSELEIELSVYTMDDEYHEVPGRLRIPLKSGLLHDIHITGNVEDGFTVSQ